MNALQKYLSYFVKIGVEKTSSTYSERLEVALQDGKLILNSKNANYSFASLHRVFQQVFQRIKIDQKPPKKMLVLGCGAGSIPSIIYNELQLDVEMDAVEIDEKVVELGNKYFGLDEFQKLTVIIDDAANYIKNTGAKYDLIAVDIFEGLNVPKEFLNQPFFEHLKTNLNNEGQLLLNFVAYNYEAKEEVSAIEQRLNHVFGNVETFKLQSINRVFYSIKKG